MIRYKWMKAFMGIVLSGLLFSCSNEEFNIGEYLVESHTRVVMVDTLTVRLSNMADTDSVITSNMGVGFAGYYNDPEIGTTRAQSFVEFSRTTDTESNRFAEFDSVVLVLTSNGNYYGDTLKRPAIRLYQLVEPVEMRDDGYLYSTSQVPVGAQLVDTTFRMKIAIKDTAAVRLPNWFGEWLFTGIRDNETAFTADRFLETFPGLSFAPGEGSSYVYGFGTRDTSLMIRIYYHVTTTYKQDKVMTFKANPVKSFYRTDYDPLPHLQYTSKSDPVPSSQTNHKGVIMSGSTRYVRLEFPYLNNFQELSEIVRIHEAILYVRPVRHSYDMVPLPPKLNLYLHDPTSSTQISNSPETYQTASGATDPLDGKLPTDYQHEQYPKYEFNITQFISGQLGKFGYNKQALSIAIPWGNNNETRNNSFQRLILGDQNYWYKNETQSKDNRIQLKVTYVIYND